jgi:uncharacterized membrane protein SpoIIM required for sporulation
MKARLFAYLLVIVGVLTLVVSIIVGFAVYDQGVADEYDKATKLYLVNSDNKLFQANYAIKKDLRISNLILSLSLGIGGFISGLLLICLGSIVKFKQPKN